jgi:hypothetical protein
MTDTPSNKTGAEPEDRKLSGAKGDGGEGTDPSTAATAGETRSDPNNRVEGLGGGYGGQGGGDSGNTLAGSADGIGGGTKGNPEGAYDYPEMQQARALASAVGQPGLAAAKDEKREQAGAETPAKE